MTACEKPCSRLRKTAGGLIACLVTREASSAGRKQIDVLPSEIRCEFPGQGTGRYLFASTIILAGPQGREIVGAATFGVGAQWSHREGRQGKRWRRSADGTELSDDSVHDASRRTAREDIRHRCM